MTVICEECGKVYHIDPDKLERYKGKSVRVRCGECGHVTQLSKLLETTESPAEAYGETSFAETAYGSPEESQPSSMETEIPDQPEPQPGPEEPSAAASSAASPAPEKSAGQGTRMDRIAGENVFPLSDYSGGIDRSIRIFLPDAVKRVGHGHHG